MFRTIGRYEDTSLGLPYPVVLINSAEEEIDDETGERVGVSIPNMEGLVATLAVTRAFHPVQLDGAEVKFIRRAIGMSAKSFAESLALAPETLSRWENGKQVVGDWADKQVRMAAIILLGDRAPASKVDPKAIIGLRSRPQRPGETIVIELQLDRHNAESNGDEWGLKMAA